MNESAARHTLKPGLAGDLDDGGALDFPPNGVIDPARLFVGSTESIMAGVTENRVISNREVAGLNAQLAEANAAGWAANHGVDFDRHGNMYVMLHRWTPEAAAGAASVAAETPGAHAAGSGVRADASDAAAA